MMGANEVLGRPLDRKDILRIATYMEGHPDNVTPALLGGVVISAMEEGEVYSIRIPLKNSYDFITIVPDYHLPTEKARAALPDRIPRKDATYNVSRATLLVSALMTGQDEMIRIGFQDRMHQPYRGDLIPGFDRVISMAGELGVLGSYLSGAGSTIMCLSKEGDDQVFNNVAQFIGREFPSWDVYRHKLENQGAIVL
jgi:homoserine kinase